MYAVYILKSLKDGRTYVGCSKDLDNRIKEHNAGEVKSTKSRTPFILWYKEEFADNMKHLNVNNILKHLGGEDS